MEYISITFRDHRRKRKRVPRREKQTKKKGLEGESRRKMSIPTGSDPPISVYMIIYYVRMSICLWKLEKQKKKAKLGKISRRSLTE